MSNVIGIESHPHDFLPDALVVLSIDCVIQQQLGLPAQGVLFDRHCDRRSDQESTVLLLNDCKGPLSEPQPISDLGWDYDCSALAYFDRRHNRCSFWYTKSEQQYF